MNEFVITIGGKKKNVKVVDYNHVEIENKKYEIELSKVNSHLYFLKIGDKVYDVVTSRNNSENYSFFIDGFSIDTTVRTKLREKANEFLKQKAKQSHFAELKAPMPGLILKLKKEIGDSVEIGESVAVLEAMKMENDLQAPASGKIKEIMVSEGASVEKDAAILTIE
jgi:biotin carboxyl carrier protein